MKNNKLTISSLELDYLKVNGELLNFDVKKTKHRDCVKNYMLDAGLKESKFGDDWVLYENKEVGLKAFLSNFPMNNKKASRRPTLSVDFSGHYFIRPNSDLAARKLLRFFIDKFGVFFKISRVDIRQDVYNARFPFDYFPDFTDRKNNLVWALRGKPEFNQYHNGSPTGKATGFCLRTSRYAIKSYNRNLALKQKYRRGELTKSYYDYYNRLYKGRDVQRLEVSLKQDACKIFSLLFFGAEYEKEKILSYTMANFARNHALKKFEHGKKINHMEVDQVFADLFYYEKKNEVKMFKVEFEDKAGLKMSEVTYSDKGRSVTEIIKMLSKKMCEVANGCKFKMEELNKLVETKMTEYLEEFKNIVEDRRIRYEKSMSYMRLDLLEMEKCKQKLLVEIT